MFYIPLASYSTYDVSANYDAGEGYVQNNSQKENVTDILRCGESPGWSPPTDKYKYAGQREGKIISTWSFAVLKCGSTSPRTKSIFLPTRCSRELLREVGLDMIKGGA